MPTIERPTPSFLLTLATSWSYGGVFICLLGALYSANSSTHPVGPIIILAGLSIVFFGYIRTRRICIYGVEVEAKCTRSRGYKGMPVLHFSYVFNGTPYNTVFEVDIIRAFGGRLHLGGTGEVTLIIDRNSPQRVLIKKWFYPLPSVAMKVGCQLKPRKSWNRSEQDKNSVGQSTTMK